MSDRVAPRSKASVSKFRVIVQDECPGRQCCIAWHLELCWRHVGGAGRGLCGGYLCFQGRSRATDKAQNAVVCFICLTSNQLCCWSPKWQLQQTRTCYVNITDLLSSESTCMSTSASTTDTIHDFLCYQCIDVADKHQTGVLLQDQAPSSKKKGSRQSQPSRPATLSMPREELKMVLCVNQSLNMGKGKIGRHGQLQQICIRRQQPT